ncbi:MAG TPA: lyase family protein [Thermomicrobiales bacterium]|nr:lyase family protein [Thermomicrobiales bacterium]
MNATEPQLTSTRQLWRHIGEAVAAHVVMLSDVGLIDDDATATLLGAIDTVSGGEPPETSLAGLVADFDDRVDAQTPSGIAGTARVGRGTADAVATALRLWLRDRVLDCGAALDGARRAALDLAAANVTTLMPAYVGGQPAQPTNLGHFLGGLIGPLGRSGARLPAVYAEVNRSPLGAAAFASSGMGIDRERAAELLAFDGLAVNTLDAVSAADHLILAGEFAAGIATAIRRLIAELLTWLRTEPESFRLTEEWSVAAADLPQVRIPTRLDALIARAREVESSLAALRNAANDLPYGPTAWSAEALLHPVQAALDGCNALLTETTELLSTGLDVNRAYLANRAGQNHTTTSDLADFLMIEEQLDPGTAQLIAARTTARIIADGIETSGITPELIDAAALIVLGREIKVEFEAISRYLAPRRFLERRIATGAPSPVATRAYLDQEFIRLGTDERWRSVARQRLSDAADSLRQIVGEAGSRV